MGSNRSNFGPPEEEILARNFIAQSHPRPLDISASNPTAVGLELPDWGRLLRDHFDPLYQPDARGLKRAREALAAHETPRTRASAGAGAGTMQHAQEGGSESKLDPDWCFLTASTSESYSFALNALCDPGDAILVPRPSYPLFDQLAQLAGVRLIHYSIAFDGAWHVDLGSLPSQETLRREKVRAVVAVSPNNPTGNILRHEEWNALCALGLPLLIDEVFRPYQHVPSKNAIDPLSRLDPKVPTLIFDGLSKRACAPGLKLGWVWILGESAELLRQRFEMISDTFLSVASPVQTALPHILSLETNSQQVVQTRITANRALLKTLLTETALTWIPSQAGWSEIIRLPAVLEESAWWTLLAQAGVLVQAGQLYDLSLSPSFVISNITPTPVLEDALLRMISLVNAKLA